jgi:hypothetical protein
MSLVTESGVPLRRARHGFDPASNTVEFAYDSIEVAFPKCDAGLLPLGNLVLVQIRQPMNVTKGGIEIPAETRQTEHDNTQVAKVIAMGPLAFRSYSRDQPCSSFRG